MYPPPPPPREIEPRLRPITDEQMRYRTATSGDEVWLDIKARGFWRRNQATFFDINVTHMNAASYRNLSQEQILKYQESKKERRYNQRVMEVEGVSFTPLVFGTNGTIGKECNTFISNLATKLFVKRNEQYANIVNWIRTRYSVSLLRATLLCVRGSTDPWKNNAKLPEDFGLAVNQA